MKSPFQYGTLVDKESFVNRVEERKQLKELLGSGINVMLISPRRWGKSSLVKVAMDELTQEDKHIRVCFIDAFSIKTEAEFYRIFAREVISCAASTLEKRLEDVKQFLKAVSPSITLKSDPTDTLSFDLKLELEEKSVMEILELPEKIAAAKGIHLIVCIDEFQQLALLPGYKSMEGKMIIVSQEQNEILNFNNIMNIQVTNCEEDGYLISAGFIVGRDDNYRDLGYYKTEERAKEVLAEIVQKYSSYLQLNGGPAILQGQMDIQPNIFNIPKVYEMPEK